MKVIDYRQEPETTPIEELVGHEIHRPDLVCRRRRRPGRTVAARPFAAWRLRPDRQPFFAVKAMHALAVYDPAFPSQQDMEPAIPVPDPRRRQILRRISATCGSCRDR
jgi:hypothetical protein